MAPTKAWPPARTSFVLSLNWPSTETTRWLCVEIWDSCLQVLCRDRSCVTPCVPFLREPSVPKPLHGAGDAVPAAAASRRRMSLWARGSHWWESRGCCVWDKLPVGGMTAGGCDPALGGFEEHCAQLRRCFEEEPHLRKGGFNQLNSQQGGEQPGCAAAAWPRRRGPGFCADCRRCDAERASFYFFPLSNEPTRGFHSVAVCDLVLFVISSYSDNR